MLYAYQYLMIHYPTKKGQRCCTHINNSWYITLQRRVKDVVHLSITHDTLPYKEGSRMLYTYQKCMIHYPTKKGQGCCTPIKNSWYNTLQRRVKDAVHLSITHDTLPYKEGSRMLYTYQQLKIHYPTKKGPGCCTQRSPLEFTHDGPMAHPEYMEGAIMAHHE